MLNSSLGSRRGRGTRRYRQASSSSRSSHLAQSSDLRSTAERTLSHWSSTGDQERVAISPRPVSAQAPPITRPATPASNLTNVRSAPDDVEESLDHVIVAIDVKEKGRIGCAYYIAREERLLCMEDVPKGGLDTIERRQPVDPLLSLVD